MSKDCRQHYQIATGSGKQTAEPSRSPHPGFKKGGRVGAFKKGAQNRAGGHGHTFQTAGKSKGNC